MPQFRTARPLSVAVLACAVAAGVALVAAPLNADPQDQARPEARETRQAFSIDPVHSSVNFRIKHMDVAYFLGRFNKMSGTMLVDPSNPADSFIDITIDAASVDTNNSDRDAHVRSGDYLGTEQFPTATFKSKSFAKAGDNLKATGDFTLHGVTKEITVDVDFTGQADGRHGERQGIEVKFDFDRTDYGIGAAGGLSDEVNMHVSLEAVR